MEWFFFVFIPVLVALFSDDDKKTVKRSRAMKRGTVAKLESGNAATGRMSEPSGRLSAGEAAPSGQKVVKVVLSEDKDADIIEFLKHCENKGEFFRFAAREFIEREEE